MVPWLEYRITRFFGSKAPGSRSGACAAGRYDLRLAGPLQPADLDVADHTHDRASVIQVPENPPDRILAGPVTLSEGRAHDGDPRAVGAIAVFDDHGRGEVESPWS